MIMEFWNHLSYMVQLITACLLFMFPARKRRRFLSLISVTGILLLLVSYYINYYFGDLSKGFVSLFFGALYIIICIFFVWMGLDCNMFQAVYCGVCACGMQHIAFDVYMIYILSGGSNLFIQFMIYGMIYLLFCFFFIRYLPEKGEFVISRKALFPIVTIIALVWILSIFETSSIIGFEAGKWHRIIYRMVDGCCCFYALWVQISQKINLGLTRELDGINQAWRQQAKQYQMTSETIDSINRKCHDLKHQIRAIKDMTDEQKKIEFLDEIENDIMIYDTALSTGNKALDTVLMEKGLFCKTHGIQWSCMADGAKLDFMKLEDIYAIFGNALENAVSAVLNLEDAGKRVISVKIISQGSLIMIQIQNYYEGSLKFEDGLPLTTNKSSRKDHGYGMKSIRYTAEKYGGTITVMTEEEIFTLQILFPASKNL